MTPWHILIVDDNADDRAEVRRMLLRGADRHYVFHEAETAREVVAIALGMQPVPDCIVLDFSLPDGTALDVLAALSRPTGTCPCAVVVLTGAGGRTLATAVLRAGAQDFVGKAWTTEESLTRAVENAVERWSLTRELHDSETRFRHLAAAVPQAVWTADVSGALLYVNERWADAFGERAPAPDGSGYGFLRSGIHPEDREEVLRRVDEYWRRGESFTLDVRLLTVGGEHRWYQLAATPVRNRRGEVTQWYGVTSDVHDRKETKRRLRLALEASKTGIWTWDLRTDAVTWSPEAYAIHGMSDAAFAGTGTAFFALVHPDDRGAVELAVRTAIRDRTTYRAEFRIVRPSGDIVWVENLGLATYDGEGSIGVLGTIVDVTDRKRAELQLHESEATLRAIAETVTSILFMSDAEGRPLYESPAWFAYTGTRHEDLVTRGWGSFYHPEDRAALFALWSEARTHGRAVAYEARVRRHDGAYRWFACRVAPMTDAAGRTAKWVGVMTDIDERRQAEQTLRESEARASFQAHLLANAAEAMVATDEDSAISYWNRAAEELFGWTAAEVLGKPSAPILRAQLPRPARGEAVPGSLERGTYQAEGTYTRKDGTDVATEVRNAVLRDANGRLRGTITACRDITERKQIEDEKARLEQELKLDLDAMTRLQRLDAAFLKERDIGRTLAEVVDAAIAITGADFGNLQLVDSTSGNLESAASRGLEDWYIAFWDGATEGQGARGAALATRERVVVEDVETSAIFVGTPGLEMQRRAGVRAVQSTPLLSSSGRPLGLLSTHFKNAGRPDEQRLRWLDVLAREVASILERFETEEALRRHDKLLRLVLSNSAVVLFTQDLDLRYTWIENPSPGFDQLVVLGKTDAEVFPEDTTATLAEIKRAVLTTGTPRHEVVQTRIGGRLFWYDLRCEPLLDDAGRIVGVACVSIDVTDLRAAIQQRDDVLGIVAHDLRSPLGTILLQTELMRAPGSDPDHRHKKPVETIRRAASRMERIIEDLLDVTQLDAGRLVLNRATVTPQLLLAEVRASQEPVCSARSLELHESVAADLPAVRVDRDRILQVFENLVGNAAKFTRAGSITIGAKPGERDVVFWVSDTGAGISEEDQHRLFDRFWQGRAGRRAGAGLGLAIVKGIVEAHGGRLWVTSELGTGSTFWFTLPADAVVGTADEVAVRERSVLVADDDADLRETLAELLRSHGHHVVVVTNGREALEQVRTAPRPKLMIIDLAMPVLDGWGVLAERERDAALRSLPVIVVSGQRDVAARVAAAHATFLPKPLSGERLFEVLDDLTRASGGAPTS